MTRKPKTADELLRAIHALGWSAEIRWFSYATGEERVDIDGHTGGGRELRVDGFPSLTAALADLLRQIEEER
jgi:hypothetical protein